MELICWIIKIILLLVLIFDICVVLLSYSIFWYELANSSPQLLQKRATRANLSLTVKLLLPEMILNYLTLIIIPLGLIRPGKTVATQGETPTLLLHGLFVSHSCWFWFKRQLKKQGITHIHCLNLSSWHNEEVLTELVAKKIDELRHQFGVDKVNIIGHSMGGIIARNYVQLRGGEDKVAKLICLGSPHGGTKLATFTLASLGKILLPGSAFLKRLNGTPFPAQVKLFNILTLKDNMVIPNTNCQSFWGENIELDQMGHTSLIYRKAAIEAVRQCLSRKTEA